MLRIPKSSKMFPWEPKLFPDITRRCPRCWRPAHFCSAPIFTGWWGVNHANYIQYIVFIRPTDGSSANRRRRRNLSSFFWLGFHVVEACECAGRWGMHSPHRAAGDVMASRCRLIVGYRLRWHFRRESRRESLTYDSAGGILLSWSRCASVFVLPLVLHTALLCANLRCPIICILITLPDVSVP